MNKIYCLEKAIEITKEYARSGSLTSLDVILENIYRKLKELDEDANK